MAGIALGLAVGTKYNAAPIVLAILLAHFLRTGWRGYKDWRLYMALAASAGVSWSRRRTRSWIIESSCRVRSSIFATTLADMRVPPETAGLVPELLLANGRPAVAARDSRHRLGILLPAPGNGFDRHDAADLPALHQRIHRPLRANGAASNPLLGGILAGGSGGQPGADPCRRPTTRTCGGGGRADGGCAGLSVGRRRAGYGATHQPRRPRHRPRVVRSQPTRYSCIAIESYAPWVDPEAVVQGLYRLTEHPPEWFVNEGYDYVVFSQRTVGR